jgi:uncharacterized membrane protein
MLRLCTFSVLEITMKFLDKWNLYTSEQKGVMGVFRNFLIRGALFSLPIAVTLFVTKYALSFVDAYLGEPTAALIRWVSPHWLLTAFPEGHIPGMSMILLMLVLLFLGAVASWPVGHQGLRVVDYIIPRIPILGGIYSSTRKIVETLGESNRFERAVWFELYPGVKATGFVTREFIETTTGEKHLQIFYPMVPNPTAGMLITLPEKATIPLDMDPKEVFTMMVALGTTMPDQLRIYPENPPTKPDDTQDGAEETKRD